VSGGTHVHILLSHNSWSRRAQTRENQKTGEGAVEEEGGRFDRERKRTWRSKMELETFREVEEQELKRKGEKQ
jgi:hypothetical protein